MKKNQKTKTKIKENVSTFLSFRLDKEFFAINVDSVLTILELRPITKVPNSPDYMKGVINLRGNILPVIDMHLKFGMKPIEFAKDTCIIVLSINIDNEMVQVGMLADAVDQVLEIKDSDIEETPSVGTKYKTEFVKGIFKLSDGFIMLINIDLVFNTEDVLLVESSVK
jgi:purine-binding chemotaxis protein CheW